MASLDKILRPPSYGWCTADGALSVPTTGQLWREFLSRVNVVRTRRNWQAFSSWLFTLSLAPFLVAFVAFHFSWPLVVVGFFYSMVAMGCYGTVWLHRYGTHGAFQFKSGLWKLITRNLVIRIVIDELYIISHHVHHAKPDQPGDPYNATAGGLYCFLADSNHQPIATDLTEQEYAQVCRLMETTGSPLHTYEEYLKWGSAEKPLRTYVDILLNWAFWYGAFFLLGGHALATAIFGSGVVWGVGIRTFNFAAHGSGQDRRRDGVDFNRRDRSINQLWPGFVAGEWHNNHHLFPTSARNGFRPHEIDLPFVYIRFLNAIGAVTKVRDQTQTFFERHHLPHVRATSDLAASKTSG